MTDQVVTIEATEALMVEPEILRQLRTLAARGWGDKRIARELGIARNTVRRYRRGGVAAETQVRPRRRALDAVVAAEAVHLFETTAEGNAIVVAQMLHERGISVGPRTVQRVVAARRRELRAAQVATVRYETAPGHQAQVDFGQKHIRVAGELVRVFLLVVTLCYSRRIFAKAFLAERQDDWREGIAAAFRYFGGVTQVLLGDNPRALVLGRDRGTGAVTFHPGYLAFCRDWDVEPRACAPYRARTKGKVESGVKYVKRNGLAGREFESFAALEAHLDRWARDADERVHGTTHDRPVDRFEREEHAALRPLPARPLPTRQRSVTRRVAHDAMVDVDTVRYSVPHRFVRDRVEVLVGDVEVRIFSGATLIATHARSTEPHTRVVDASHYDGLWRRADAAAAPTVTSSLARPLEAYAAIVDGGVA